jgi:hypothetical protein
VNINTDHDASVDAVADLAAADDLPERDARVRKVLLALVTFKAAPAANEKFPDVLLARVVRQRIGPEGVDRCAPKEGGNTELDHESDM